MGDNELRREKRQDAVEKLRMAGTAPRTGSVYILYRDSLLARGVPELLGNKGLAVIAVDLKVAGAWETLRDSVQPGDVVIVDKRDAQVHPCLSIFELFVNHPEIAVIGLDSCENKLELYQKQQKSVAAPEELVSLIRSCCAAA